MNLTARRWRLTVSFMLNDTQAMSGCNRAAETVNEGAECHCHLIVISKRKKPGLPAFRETIEQVSEEIHWSSMETKSEAPGTILVIEDDPRMQKVLHRIFHAEGYEVIVASDGVAGLSAFRSCVPLAVVLDPVLPQLSGRDGCRRPLLVSCNDCA